MGALAAVRRAPARRASPAGGVQRGTTQPAGHAVRWPDLDGLPGFGGGAGGPAHFKAEITRHTYRSSRGNAANAAKSGLVSCPAICAFKITRYGFILSERTSS